MARYLVLALIFVGLVVSLFFLKQAGLTGFAVFSQTGSNFNEGTYSNTRYNGSAVVLSGSNLTGTYTSKIFDAGNDAVWNNLSWEGNLESIKYIFAVDNQADVWKSTDSGTTWSLVKDDYNGADSNDVTASFFNSTKTYFIIVTQRVWVSQDYVTWTKVNDDYNGAEGQNAFVATIDRNNNIFIIEGDQDVWKSTDSGFTFTKATTDFNGGNGNFFGFVTDSSNNLYTVDNQADVWKSTDSGTTWSLVKDDYNAGAGNNADGMAIDSNNILYILDLQDVWKSSDSGISWTKVNDDFNGAGDSENAKSIITDSNNYVYVIDGGEDVFKSTDSGTTFTKIATNFNGANGITPTMATLIKSTGLTFQVKNCSLADCSDANWKSANLNNLNLVGRYFQYKVSFSSPDSSVSPYLKTINIDYTILNTAPSITLSKPQEGATFGYNSNIALQFSVSDADNNLQACWYNMDGGQNKIITGCQNTTFNASEGSHALTIYANDSYGLETSDSATFNIQLGAPTIFLNSPIDVYLAYHNIEFKYTPEDIDLDSCELWGDFSGSFSLNQTNTNPSNGIENIFSLTLQDGSYLWNIRCNDSQGKTIFNGNKSFVVDTTKPAITISQPSGTKTSRNIDASWIVSDANLQACLYNVYRGASLEVVNTSINCSLTAASFSVTVDAYFTFNLYVEDKAGNMNSASSTFTGSSTTQPSGGGGGGGGGHPTVPLEGKLTISNLGSVVVNPGDSKTLVVNVKNT